MGLGWFGAPEHNRWLAQETHALLRFARAAKVPAGFGWIGEDGQVDTSHPVETWITGRMTFAFSVGTLLGVPGCRRYADHGVRALRNVLRDRVNGGWHSAVRHELDEQGAGVAVQEGARKECYQHAFVLFAAAAATAAGRPGAHDLLVDAMEVYERYWWDEVRGLPLEAYNTDFSKAEDYRGINAAMHTVEAFLVTADVTGDLKWLERALQIIDFAVNQQARAHQWRLPEHYDARWRPVLDYNQDRPADPFRPFGVTPGHGLEWARLTVQAMMALKARGKEAPEWMLDAAEALFDRARSDGWRVDGAPGFVYTTDFEGQPVVHERMHWVVCEGVSAAAALRWAALEQGRQEIELEHFEHCYRAWLDYAEEYLIAEPGRWWHELDQDNRPSTRTWKGHPDVYHALQMTLLPRLPVWPAIPQAVAARKLDAPAPARPSGARQEGGRGRQWGFFGY